MRTSTKFICSLTAAGLAALAIIAGPQGGQATALKSPEPSPGQQELTLSSPFEGGDFHYIDLGKKGLGPGDMFTIAGLPVHDENTGRRVGSVDASETILSARHDGTVIQEATYRLRGGTVTVAGAIRHTDQPTRLPVTGGTGDYLGVTGQLVDLREDNDRNVTIFKLVLSH
jgi:hypothetical protein